MADWLVAGGTVVLAIVALFQEPFRHWIFRPKFRVSIKTEPPDCGAVAFTDSTGKVVAETIHLRLLVKNVGRTTAKNVEVFAKELRREDADGTWKRIDVFPPMNLVWSHVSTMHFPFIAPKTGKHCDLAHIVEPQKRPAVGEEPSSWQFGPQECSLVLKVIHLPNHKGHIVGPGKYQLDIQVAAENVPPLERTIEINLRGPWDPDEATMLSKHVGVRVL